MGIGDTFVYVLECEGGHIYVGRTTDPARRLRKHQEGRGAEWTRMHKPRRIMHMTPCTTLFDEDNTVKLMMIQHGIDKVRGGSYTQTELSAAQREVVVLELQTATGACFRCGALGHYANNCPDTAPCDALPAEPADKRPRGVGGAPICFNCQEPGHYSPNCPHPKRTAGKKDDA